MTHHLWTALVSLSILLVTVARDHPHQRELRLLNDSGTRIQLFWVHPETRATTLLSRPGIYDGSTFPLNTFANHEFEIHEMPSPKTGACNNEEKVCRIGRFTVSQAEDQVARVQPGIVVELGDSSLLMQAEADKKQNQIEKCQRKARSMKDESDGSAESSMILINDLANCVEQGVSQKLIKANEEISYQARIRTQIAGRLENYTCEDDSLHSTPDAKEEVWQGGADGVSRVVHVKHDRPSSQIHVIEDFINADECEAMEESAKPTLHHATVADGKGGSRLSENRKVRVTCVVAREKCWVPIFVWSLTTFL